ncbi:hypothetical protein T4C_5231 [Trichinella pseudospiralis]|uniref:Uncharacterized protein n=1 Tax=Trichinella pseudospiralis TaxID=6337 RepID=A0A0V1JU76_TRIPS|nr:hypothetical protein T4C_5231 [Trichinella pseudospiralis]
MVTAGFDDCSSDGCCTDDLDKYLYCTDKQQHSRHQLSLFD